jgi:hypothetical protein
VILKLQRNLKEYYSEMTPIFKNIEIDSCDESVIGSHMYEYNKTQKDRKRTASRKLIGSYFGENILVYTPLLK